MSTPVAALPSVALDPSAATSLQRQLYDALRGAILERRLHPGTRLPATRALAADLRVARNTVVAAFEQLAAEGYLEARVGHGTRVAALAPDDLLRARRPPPASSQRAAEGSARRARQGSGARRSEAAPPGVSRRGALLASVKRSAAPARLAFQPGLPAHDAFPFAVWGRLLGRRARRTRLDGFGYGHAAGHPPLREAIADYLGAARAVRCAAEQVMVVGGAQAALDIAARVLIDPGDAVWVEEPGYLGARGALLGAGARLVPLPVDAHGLDVAAGARRSPGARLAYVTPSRQFPTGATMSLERRLALLEWAARAGAWVVEDDYDSEYRYAGRPLAALQGLDPRGVVVYLGTFSKTMFPALRVGYLVVPERMVDAFASALRTTGQSVALAVQAALADFIAEGHLGSHVRRMRALYAARQERLLRALRERVGDELSASREEAGMHLVADLAPDLDDVAVARAAAAREVVAAPLSQYYIGPAGRRALTLGYAAVPEREIPRAVDRLAAAIADVRRAAQREEPTRRARPAGDRSRGGTR